MFRPDLFSDPFPRFRQAREQSVAEVVSALRTHYADIGAQAGPIYQSGALELNSSNFLVHGGDRRYIVKRWPLGEMPERKTIVLQAGLTNWLAQQGVPVPRIRPSTLSGALITEHAGRCWCVMEFVDGNYFSGGGQELLDVGLGLCRLFLSLRVAPHHLQISQTILPPDRQSMEMVADLERQRTRWPEIFGEPYAALLDESWRDVTEDHANVLDLVPVSLQSMGLCHIDLHPHNVLVSNGRTAAFLDFPSLLHAPVESIIAFNLFKLGRQAIVARRGRYLDAETHEQMEQVIVELRASGLVREDSWRQLSLLAKIEIMRRLLLILQLNFEKKKRTWNHVLPVHIRALKEADIVFASSPLPSNKA